MYNILYKDAAGKQIDSYGYDRPLDQVLDLIKADARTIEHHGEVVTIEIKREV